MSARRHLGDATLVALARGDRPRVAAGSAFHLAHCERCRTLLDDFRALRERLREQPIAPDRSALAAVFALAEPRPPAMPAVARLAAARLVHDSGPALQAAGARAVDLPRTQLWRIPGADVDIRIEPPGPGSSGLLHGQVFPRGAVRSPDDGSVWLLQRGRRAAWAVLGDGGEFELPAPVDRRWWLCLEWRGVRVRLDPP